MIIMDEHALVVILLIVLLFWLTDLFGGGLDDSSNSGGILSGPGWRRRLMPKAVAVTSANEKQGSPPDEQANSTKTSPINSKFNQLVVNLRFSKNQPNQTYFRFLFYS